MKSQKNDIISISGHLDIEPKLTDYDLYYLLNFNLTPHYKRDLIKLEKVFRGSHSYNGNYGEEGEFFIRSIVDPNGRKIGIDKINYNELICTISKTEPASDCPSIHCPWKPITIESSNVRPTKLIHDDITTEKSYKWLKWLIKYFFIPHKYTLNGEIKISDSILNNKRSIIIENNKIKIRKKLGTPSSSVGGSLGISTSRRSKTDDDILTNLLYKTNNNLIHWKKNKNYNTYTYKYKITDNKYITFVLVDGMIRVRENPYINVSLYQYNDIRFLKTLRGYKVKKLLSKIKEKQSEY